MPYLSGVLTGIVLTILVVFLIDHLEPDPTRAISSTGTMLFRRSAGRSRRLAKRCVRRRKRHSCEASRLQARSLASARCRKACPYKVSLDAQRDPVGRMDTGPCQSGR